MTWGELLTDTGALLREHVPDAAPQFSDTPDVVFCLPEVELLTALPHLTILIEGADPRVAGRFRCLDLWLRRDGETVTSVDLEGRALEEVLFELGHAAEAEEYAAAVPGSLDVAAPAIGAALRRILDPR